MAGCSNGANGRGVGGGGINWWSGIPSSSVYNIMEYVTISSVGNATDLGNMSITANSRTGCSNATNDRGIWWGGQV